MQLIVVVLFLRGNVALRVDVKKDIPVVITILLLVEVEYVFPILNQKQRACILQKLEVYMGMQYARAVHVIML
jgi:hypothetical protein